jgi:hypothetical protein
MRSNDVEVHSWRVAEAGPDDAVGDEPDRFVEGESVVSRRDVKSCDAPSASVVNEILDQCTPDPSAHRRRIDEQGLEFIVAVRGRESDDVEAIDGHPCPPVAQWGGVVLERLRVGEQVRPVAFIRQRCASADVANLSSWSATVAVRMETPVMTLSLYAAGSMPIRGQFAGDCRAARG